MDSCKTITVGVICGGNDNLDCIREEIPKLNTDIDSILDEILSLTSPQDTLIRIADTNIPLRTRGNTKDGSTS